jgi:transcriptional regulator with XRE-family HTH domain
MRFDHSKLKGLMREKGFSQENLSKSVGISAASLNAKLAGRSDFTAKEMYAIILTLGIEDPRPYFFAV